MNLTWHIVRKDLRRLAWPVAAWLVFLVVASASLLATTWAPEKVEWGAANDWLRTQRSNLMLAAVVAGSVAILLAGALVLEDRVVGSTSFWLARPIRGGRLLRAKLLAAALLLVVAPALVLVPVWGGAGFSAGEVLRAFWSTAAGGALTIFVAMGLAALTANIGQHAFAVLVFGGLATLAVTVLPAIRERGLGYEAALETQAGIILWSIVLVAVVVLLWQYCTRRTGFGWVLWVLTLAWVAVVRLFWVWDLSGIAGRGEATAAERQAAVEVRAGPGDLPAQWNWQSPVVSGASTHEFVAPLEGVGVVRGPRGTREVKVGRGEHWAFAAAQRVVVPKSAPERMAWNLAVRPLRDRAETAVTEPNFAGRVQFVRLRGRVLYELPFRAGADAASGGTRTRIVGPDAIRPQTMLVEERGATSGAVVLATSFHQLDTMVLVHRGSGRVSRLQIQQEQPLGLSGLMLGLLALTPESIGDTSPGEWTLVKVRFEVLGGFERDFPRLPIATAGKGGG